MVASLPGQLLDGGECSVPGRGERQRELEETAGRSVSISTVYVTMERLERKGLIDSWLADPTPVRGGKSKRFYKLTDTGLQALRESRDELDRMWQGLETHQELKSL